METRVALVTGSSRGIGRGIALALAQDGLDVAVNYNSNEAAAREVLDGITALGRRGIVLQGDAGEPDTSARLVAETVAGLGRLDVLVANVGQAEDASFLEIDVATYDVQQARNTRASFFAAQAAARQMIDQGGGGRIVFITSEAAERPFARFGAYCVSKAGQKMAMKVAASELAPHRITVNAVAPGTTLTDQNRDLLEDPEWREILLSGILLGRPGTVEDSAAAVVFLASESAAYITGCTIAVNGGSHMA